MNMINVVLVGIGGYGKKYAEHLLKERHLHGVHLVAVVDPYASKSEIYSELIGAKIPIFETLEQFYSYANADLAVISTPIHLHFEQTCYALRHGSNALCEKPAAPTVEQVREMIRVRNDQKRIVAVGFQWCHDPTVQRLKKDILSGKFGIAKKFKALVLWPRDTAYYSRSSWAGKLKFEGQWVLDSIASNAAAHFLHFMLFLLGSNMLDSAYPEFVEAELYRANKIESFDTCAMRIGANNTEILFFASHAVKERIGPVFELEFSQATVYFNHPDFLNVTNAFSVVHRDGTKEIYGVVDHSSMRKLWDVVDFLRGKERIYCTLESALSLTLAVNCAHLSSEIVDFPANLRRIEGDPPLVWVENLSEWFSECFTQGKLPNELGLPWARVGRKIYSEQCEVLEI